MKCLVLLVAVAAVSCNEQNLLKKLAVGNNQFATNLYKEVKAVHNDNFVFCPLSAYIILALTRMGTAGSTGKELSQTVHLPQDTSEIEQMFKLLTPKLKSSDDYTLNSANRIFLNNGYPIREEFLNVARNSFSADVQNINFSHKDAAAKEINQWVSQETHGKITDLIDPAMLTPDSRFVLANALYFKSTWASKFLESNTKLKPFYMNNKDQVEVDMMETTSSYKYLNSEELKAKFLEMSYKGNEYSMVVVLPNEKEGLTELENDIGKVLETSLKYTSKVHVQMPKFKIETQVEMTDMLKHMGIKDAFTDYADFTGFSGPGAEPLKISDVIQKAVIEVDEKGTTAAAATAVHGVATLSLVIQVVQEFNANYPFLYYIKGPSGVMFIGRYVKG